MFVLCFRSLPTCICKNDRGYFKEEPNEDQLHNGTKNERDKIR